MNAKRFAFLSFGVLCLMLSAATGFHIGSASVSAQGRVSNMAASSGIVAYSVVGGRRFALDEFGQSWEIQSSPVCFWERTTRHDPPFPHEQIKFWGPRTLIMNDNHLWINTGESEPLWQDCGLWPGGTVNTSPSTMGAVKDKFK